MKGVESIETAGKLALVRCAFNVPLDGSGNIRDDFRLRRTLPTLELLRSQGARLVLMSHIGRHEDSLSLRPVALRLGQLLGTEVAFSSDCVGPKAEQAAASLGGGGVALLENLRLHREEQENDQAFARALSRLGDLYVNDAFAVSHRAHASLVQLPRLLPSAAGLLLQEEIAALSRVADNPQRPFVVIVGGSKVESKARFLKAMLGRADSILVGNLVAASLDQETLQHPSLVPAVDGRPDGKEARDIGPAALEVFQEKIQGAGTVLWTGPLGKVEEEEYTKGSLEVARALAGSTAFSVVGGGNLGDFLGDCGLREKVSYVSTGGSAMLAFVAGDPMPGIQALEKSNG